MTHIIPGYKPSEFDETEGKTEIKTALILGAGGFIGSHLAKRLKSENYFVMGADLKLPDFSETAADNFVIVDLRIYENCKRLFEIYQWDEVYQLAADMGGAGYIFTGEHDADILHNSAQINLNIARLCLEHKAGKVFYSSSACMYPSHNQEDPNNPLCSEESAYPANPDSEYGWEKLFSERLYLAYARSYGLNVRIARFHNIFGPEGTWKGGKEKAPAAMCRKVAEAKDNKGLFALADKIEVWGDGRQTRSFLYIDECVEAVRRLMESDFTGPVNIGSEEMVTINQLAQIVIDISGKHLKIKNIPSNAVGVAGRNSDNQLIAKMLGWEPNYPLRKGMEQTYAWINLQVQENNKK